MPKKKKLYNLERKIISALRKISRSCPAKNECLKLAIVPELKKRRYFCKKCKKEFRKEYVRVDHIDQIGQEPSRYGDVWVPSWDSYILKMICAPQTNLQVLCVDCHETKSLVERQMRKSS